MAEGILLKWRICGNGQKNKQVQKYPAYGMINKRPYTGYLFWRAAGQRQACLTLAAAAGRKTGGKNMYRVQFTALNRKNKKKDTKEFMLGAVDTPEYDAVMDQISDTLYDMDLEYNDIDGDGDMAVDDMLIAISEEEDFEKSMQGRQTEYFIKGENL